jgi:hypothetical protein
MEEDNVAFRRCWVGARSCRPSVDPNEVGVDVEEHVRPHLTDGYIRRTRILSIRNKVKNQELTMDLCKGLQIRILERVHRPG